MNWQRRSIVSCIDSQAGRLACTALAGLALLAASGCSSRGSNTTGRDDEPVVIRVPAGGSRASTAPTAAPTSGQQVATVSSPRGTARNWDAYQRQAAQRLVQANPNVTYTGAVPEPLLAIPVLEVELNSDGSVRNIIVKRQPTQARETVQVAIDAVKRAAPYGDVSGLPKPWKFTEVFLFDDSKRFKPRTLDN
jgi:protein TonB